MDASGNLYGTTEGRFKPLGGVFELSPTATPPWRETELGTFSYNPPSGNRTYGGLIFDSVGSLYGTSSAGGTNNFGVVFEVNH
jgi:uncharacterized repeat protein (TIGR03803 family)